MKIYINQDINENRETESCQSFYKKIQEVKNKINALSKNGNLYQDLEMSSLYVEFQRDISMDKDIVELHNHTFYEIIFVISGSLEYLLDDKRYSLSNGDIILIPPGSNHRPIFQESFSIPYERYVLWINKKYFQSFEEVYPDLGYCFKFCKKHEDTFILPVSSGFQESLTEIFKKGFYEQSGERLCKEIGIKISAFQILLMINRFCEKNQNIQVSPAQNELIDQVLGYIKEHISEPLTLKRIADEFYVSVSTVSHLFKKAMDTSFYQWLMQKRLMMAKSKLTNGEQPTKIWQECGFSDYSAFYRAFKKKFEISPREYSILYHRKNER